MGNKRRALMIVVCFAAGFILGFSYIHVGGKEIVGAADINETCEVEISRRDLFSDESPQRYVLEAPQMEQLKQLILNSSFTRRLRVFQQVSHESVTYHISIYFNDRQDVLSLDCMGGDHMLVYSSFSGWDDVRLNIHNPEWISALEEILQSAALQQA